jgi:hypothetical protein
VKPAEILMRLRSQFVDGTLSRTPVFDWSKSFKEGGTVVGTWPYCRDLMSNVTCESQDVLFIDFLTEQ